MHQLVQMTEIINAWAGRKYFVVETETVFIGSEAAQGIWKPKQSQSLPGIHRNTGGRKLDSHPLWIGKIQTRLL